mgnify:CR=1 FL=1
MTEKSFDAVEKLIQHSLNYPELTPDKLLVMDEKLLTKIATPAKMELVKVIKAKSPRSVGELARLVKRPVESVSRDLKTLCFHGLVELVQAGKEKKPRTVKEVLVIPLK